MQTFKHPPMPLSSTCATGHTEAEAREEPSKQPDLLKIQPCLGRGNRDGTKSQEGRPRQEPKFQASRVKMDDEDFPPELQRVM